MQGDTKITAEHSLLNGKQVLITGATSGIGLAAAVEMAKRGAKLAIVARNQARAEQAVREIAAAAGSDSAVDVLLADLSLQGDVRRAAAEALERFDRLDVLVNNAGALFAGRQMSQDRIELTWAVNHIAPFLLTTLLLDRLQQSAPARVVVTAGELHRIASPPTSESATKGKNASFSRYCETKLANILFTAELARRMEGKGVTANSFHPGFTATQFNRNNGSIMNGMMALCAPFARSPEKGAETLVWLAESPDVADVTGGYFIDKRQRKTSATARDPEIAERLWQISEAQVRGSKLTA